MGGGAVVLGMLAPFGNRLWERVPAGLRRRVIDVRLAREWRAWENLTLRRTAATAQWHRWVAKLEPPEAWGKPEVDYKRQLIRGDLVIGTRSALDGEGLPDWQRPIPEHPGGGSLPRPRSRAVADATTLAASDAQPDPETAWTDKSTRFQSWRAYFAAALVFWAVNGERQRRPVVWCMDKELPAPPHYPWAFAGPLGAYDARAVRRGYEVYRQVCATCHGMKRLHFREMTFYPEARLKQMAAQFEVEDGPDDTGQMFTRPCTPNDAFPEPYPNEETARFANGGAVPPDLSLISSARMHGPHYLTALLLGYRDPPAGVELRDGLSWNLWFPGNALAMPPPLEDGLIEYEDGTPASAAQMAKDVSEFFAWASEPTHDARKLLGLKLATVALIGSLAFGTWARFAMSTYGAQRITFPRVNGGGPKVA